MQNRRDYAFLQGRAGLAPHLPAHLPTLRPPGCRPQGQVVEVEGVVNSPNTLTEESSCILTENFGERQGEGRGDGESFVEVLGKVHASPAPTPVAQIAGWPAWLSTHPCVLPGLRTLPSFPQICQTAMRCASWPTAHNTGTCSCPEGGLHAGQQQFSARLLVGQRALVTYCTSHRGNADKVRGKYAGASRGAARRPKTPLTAILSPRAVHAQAGGPAGPQVLLLLLLFRLKHLEEHLEAHGSLASPLPLLPELLVHCCQGRCCQPPPQTQPLLPRVVSLQKRLLMLLLPQPLPLQQRAQAGRALLPLEPPPRCRRAAHPCPPQPRSAPPPAPPPSRWPLLGARLTPWPA